MTAGPKSSRNKARRDVQDLDFQTHVASTTQRMLWFAGMASVSVVLLAAAGLLQMRQDASDALMAADVTRALEEADDTVIASAPICASDLDAHARAATIHFAANSAALDPGDIPSIRLLAEALTACPGMTLQVWGHADGSGSDANNLKISRLRAQNTIAHLEAMGFDVSSFELVAAGANLPLAQGDTDEALDRRVEFYVIPLE